MTKEYLTASEFIANNLYCEFIAINLYIDGCKDDYKTEEMILEELDKQFINKEKLRYIVKKLFKELIDQDIVDDDDKEPVKYVRRKLLKELK